MRRAKEIITQINGLENIEDKNYNVRNIRIKSSTGLNDKGNCRGTQYYDVRTSGTRAGGLTIKICHVIWGLCLVYKLSLSR